MLFYLVLLASISTKDDVISTFRKVKEIQLSPDSIHRNDFHENEFLPAVEKMILLEKENPCLDCLVEYLKALTFKAKSADEMVTDQLGKIVSMYPTRLNMACTTMPADSLDQLSDTFKWAIKNLAYTTKKNETKIRTSVKNCLKLQPRKKT